jgi:hypothetical protein
MEPRVWQPADPEPKVGALEGNLPKRMWVNQPSTAQEHHCYHGERVLAMHDYGGIARVYFLAGEVVSMQMPWRALSCGWPAERCP